MYQTTKANQSRQPTHGILVPVIWIGTALLLLGIAVVFPYSFVMALMALFVILVVFIVERRLPVAPWIVGTVSAILVVATGLGFAMSIFLTPVSVVKVEQDQVQQTWSQVP